MSYMQRGLSLVNSKYGLIIGNKKKRNKRKHRKKKTENSIIKENTQFLFTIKSG